MFHSIFLQTDVTAVRIWKNFIFASKGGFLSIYEKNSNNSIYKKEIFEGQKIFDFKFNLDGTKLIIYGGKNIALVSNINHCKKLDIIQKQTLSDWILDAKWIENDTKIVTVFMHNKITVWTEDIKSETSVKCEERCILYSAHICYDKFQELIVLSGTVFSEVLLWKPYYRTKDGLSPVLKRLKQHNGVIFSLHCNLEKGLVCSTSDDRSAILWKVTNKELFHDLSPVNSSQLEVISVCQVYGHLSRVFRCFVLSNFFVTAGEDSLLIIWNFEGEMIRKIDTHQGGPIWSLDYDPTTSVICTGGNDGGISLYKCNPEIVTDKMSLPNGEIPRAVGILHSGNIVCLSETATVYYFHKATRQWKEIARHSDLKSYSILQISPCKKMVALAGFKGQIYIYQEKNDSLIEIYKPVLKNTTRIFSFHWITCKSFLVCQHEGKLYLCFLYENQNFPVQTFVLPASKERWSNSACILNDHIIVGDRKGNVFNFKIGKKYPINAIKKAHSHLGITKLYACSDTITSLGRDGILKRYKLFNGFLEYIDSNKSKFSWLAALDNDYLLSFSGDSFVISNHKLQRILFEICCGGGHRSWDFLNTLKTITFCFIKDKVLNIVDLVTNDIVPKDVVCGYHINEINCVKAIHLNGIDVLISGGEDTILRISALESNSQIKIFESLKVHLSSIRSIVLYKLPQNKTKSNIKNYLIFTGGGRAQIILWHLSINVSTRKITCCEKHNFYEPLSQDQVETRIMHMAVLETHGQITLFSGCSDGCIKMFSVSDKMVLKYQKSISYTLHSITKIDIIFMLDKAVLVSMNTNGDIAFWDVLNVLSNENISPLNSYKIHQSGINSFSYKKISNTDLLILSGGDDNSVILTVFKFSKPLNDLCVIQYSSFEDKQNHCAQITGAYLGDNYFVTSSIDQRIIIWRWTNSKDNLSFHCVQRYITTIADPQGLECFVDNNNLNMYIYGIGIEHLIVFNDFNSVSQ